MLARLWSHAPCPAPPFALAVQAVLGCTAGVVGAERGAPSRAQVHAVLHGRTCGSQVSSPCRASGPTAGLWLGALVPSLFRSMYCWRFKIKSFISKIPIKISVMLCYIIGIWASNWRLFVRTTFWWRLFQRWRYEPFDILRVSVHFHLLLKFLASLQWA